MKKILASLVVMSMILCAPAAFAHFQMIYTPKSALGEGDSSKIPMILVFTHPFEAGHTMSMGLDANGDVQPPKMFSVVNKGATKDLLDTLEQITFKSLTNDGVGYETEYRLKGMGDFVFCLDPGPYYEGAEDIYIQQITKVIVNKGGAPTDWDAEVGLPVEIVPLDKPYALWTGNVFRGVVMRKEGDAMVHVPFAENEVEYMNHDIAGHSFVEAAKVEAPNDNFVTMGIKANKDGEFSFGIPKAGWWGFCALGAGGELEHEGKELSMDAVIWIQAVDID
jgi:cobalt/nickel transport protein